MIKQIIFALALLVTLGVFAYTVSRYVKLFKITRPAFPLGDWVKRFSLMIEVAIAQSKMFRKPFTGILHALVFWGFLVILVGSIEMVIDGLFGTERSLGILGLIHDVFMASGDVFALIIILALVVFISRRVFFRIKRFEGEEMTHRSHIDAKIALALILILMVTLLGLNSSYVAHQTATGQAIVGSYPVSSIIASMYAGMSANAIHVHHEFHWWAHILLIFVFANYLPYSKHFHVFMSVPNVFLSRIDPLGKLPNMDNITREVKLMMNPETAFAAQEGEMIPERFGVKDAEDSSWKNFLDSLACTQCGRCTSVCPASITGKKLSPRKIIMDLRSRMNQKADGLIKTGRDYDDGKSLIRDYIAEEELWACTTCNACAMECPININHPTFIVDMRRYLVMEEGSAPGELKSVFNNIENNGAPWQYSSEDRLNWANNIEINTPNN